jgi:hypothetical protein
VRATTRASGPKPKLTVTSRRWFTLALKPKGKGYLREGSARPIIGINPYCLSGYPPMRVGLLVSIDAASNRQRGARIVTRILIADDHDVVRSGLRTILEAQPSLEVVAEAADGKEAVLKAVGRQPRANVACCLGTVDQRQRVVENGNMRLRFGRKSSSLQCMKARPCSRSS